MDLSKPSPPDPDDLRQRFVTAGTGSVRRYLKLLHGNFLRLEEADGSRPEFLRSLTAAARDITAEELTSLLGESNWRPRLTAAWLIGWDRRSQFREQLGELLMESRLCFTGQGYCFALARFGGEADARILSAYLDLYLGQPELRYDQAWAMGALIRIDERTGSAHAAPFRTPGGLWERWAQDYPYATEPGRFMRELCTVADEFEARAPRRS